MSTYVVFWTYWANYANRPVAVRAESPADAIRKAFPANGKEDVRYIVIEVATEILGIAVTHDGTLAEAVASWEADE